MPPARSSSSTVPILRRLYSANIYDRAKLRAGNRIRGPAIITQMDATTVIHPNHTGEVDEYLSILVRPDKAS